MADTTKPRPAASAPRPRGSSAPEDQVYGTLGALLGTLEVVAMDDLQPLSSQQADRLQSALGLCRGLQSQLEALLTLASDDLEQRLRLARCAVQPLIDHAVRGALRAEGAQARLQLPEWAEWSEQRLLIDVSRVDRMLRALAEAQVGSLGVGGVLEVAVHVDGRHLQLELLGARADARGAAADCPLAWPLLERAARRLFEAHGGSFALDLEQLAVRIRLPRAELA